MRSVSNLATLFNKITLSLAMPVAMEKRVKMGPLGFT